MNSSLTVAIVLVVAKKDFAGLLRRFDGNLNGRLDDAEWQRVQIAAQMEAKQRYRQATSCADWHRLYKPGEAQPFILSSSGNEGAVRHLRGQALLSALVCLTGACVTAVRINQGL